MILILPSQLPTSEFNRGKNHNNKQNYQGFQDSFVHTYKIADWIKKHGFLHVDSETTRGLKKLDSQSIHVTLML